MTLGVGLIARHREYYKGDGGGFPQIRVVVNFVNPCLAMVRPCTKSAPTTPTCCLVCANPCEKLIRLSVILVPIPELQHTPLPPKCCKLGNAP
jgi:hypothetical protein